MGIPGYRALDPTDIARMTDTKILEEELLRHLDHLAEFGAIDQRWLAIGRTAIETGFMAVNRAIARPVRLTDENLTGGIRS